MSDSTNKGLIGAIIFAAVVVSGSLVFFGMQFFGGSNLSDEELLTYLNSEYIKKQTHNGSEKRLKNCRE